MAKAALEMLRAKADFQALQSESRSRSHPLLMLRYRSNGLERTRFGLSTGRRIGSAVVRNRLRRQLRTILGSRQAEIGRGWDVLLVVRTAAAGARQADLDSALTRLIRAAGLMKSEEQLDITSGAR